MKLAWLRQLSWPELRHHPWRHLAALLAITLGVALAFSVQLINQSALGEFSAAVRAGKHEEVLHQLKQFVLPYIALRNRGRGYAVSIVKAGCRLVGRDAGLVRPPLTDLTSAEDEELRTLIARVAPGELASAA